MIDEETECPEVLEQNAGCVCVPPEQIRCSTTSDCPEGETCHEASSSQKICVSAGVVNTIPTFETPDDGEGTALMLDPCEDNSDCLDPRPCRSVKDQSVTDCAGEGNCVCYGKLEACTTTSNCHTEGEICAVVASGAQFCASSAVVDQHETLVEVNPDAPKPTEGPGSGDGKGLTGDRCRATEDCLGPRGCMFIEASGEVFDCNDRFGCRCLPESPLECDDNSDCKTEGEACALFQSGNKLCSSKEMIEARHGVEEVEPGESTEPAEVDDDGVPDGKGLTGDSCKTGSDCADPRDCLDDTGVFRTCGEKEGCICLPPNFVPCESNLGCEGEVCASVYGSDPLCVSPGFVKRQPSDAELVDPEGPIEDRGPVDTQGGYGLTGDYCFDDEDCYEPRKCVIPTQSSLDPSLLDPCTEKFGCYCLPSIEDSIRCEGDLDCGESGEVCARFPDGIQYCVSPAYLLERNDLVPVGDTTNESDTGPAESEDDLQGTREPPSFTDPNEASLFPTITPEAASCISIHSLRHLEREELVFGRDRMETVLCDRRNSCATAGHMVRFKGRGMMMRSYCGIVRCDRRRMFVNSPKYRRGLLVPSRSEGLVFTAFAARFATRVEEHILTAAVHLGL